MTQAEIDGVLRRDAGFIVGLCSYAGIGVGLLVMNLVLGWYALAVWNLAWLIWAPLFAYWGISQARQMNRAIRSARRWLSGPA